MNFWLSIALIASLSIASSIITYLLTTLGKERAAAEQRRALAEAVSTLEAEKAKLQEAARGIEENARRKERRCRPRSREATAGEAASPTARLRK